MQYKTEKIKIRLKTVPVEFGMNCRPLDPSVYQKLDQRFSGRPVFDIWEKTVPGGQSWLGVVDPKGDMLIEGEFMVHIHTGSYKELVEIGMQIGSQHKNMTEFYFAYLNSPFAVKEHELQTKIVFKE